MSLGSFGLSAGKWFLNFISGGAISDREKAAQDAAAAKIRLQMAEDARAQSYNNSLKQANIDARKLDLEAKQVGEESRAGAISVFKAESSGAAELATSGLAEGSSPYATLDSSVSEAQRKLRNLDIGNRETLDLGVSSVQMSQDNARFDLRQRDANIELLKMDLENAQEGLSGWNSMLSFYGGAMSTIASIYSIGTNIGALGIMAEQAGGLQNLSLTDLFKQASAMKYASLTGDTGPFDALFKKSSDVGLGGFTLKGLDEFAVPDFSFTKPKTPKLPSLLGGAL